MPQKQPVAPQSEDSPSAPLGLWTPALGFVLYGAVSTIFTLLLLAWPDAASSKPNERIGAAIIAVLCALGWWGTFRAGRGILRSLRRGRTGRPLL